MKPINYTKHAFGPENAYYRLEDILSNYRFFLLFSVNKTWYNYSKVDIHFIIFIIIKTDIKKTLYQILLYYLDPVLDNVKPHVERNNDFKAVRQQNSLNHMQCPIYHWKRIIQLNPKITEIRFGKNSPGRFLRLFCAFVHAYRHGSPFFPGQLI